MARPSKFDAEGIPLKAQQIAWVLDAASAWSLKKQRWKVGSGKKAMTMEGDWMVKDSLAWISKKGKVHIVSGEFPRGCKAWYYLRIWTESISPTAKPTDTPRLKVFHLLTDGDRWYRTSNPVPNGKGTICTIVIAQTELRSSIKQLLVEYLARSFTGHQPQYTLTALL
jgi:hypothetical protein